MVIGAAYGGIVFFSKRARGFLGAEQAAVTLGVR